MLRQYFHTVRYLRWQQILFRFVYLLRKPVIPNVECLPLQSWAQKWLAPTYIQSRFTAEGDFICLQKRASLTAPDLWQNEQYSKLWLYHLHYFDACRAQDAFKTPGRIQNYIETWLLHNPPLQGPGWDPYPISLRVVNWIIWFASGVAIPPAHWHESLILQAEVLTQRLEYHLLGNHLFANAKALIFLGSYFSGDKAQQWLEKGLRILDRELDEQFLPDGAHFELSPMYHALLIWDICDLYYLAHCVPCPLLQSRIPIFQKIMQQGMQWLEHMSHPDGDIAFFNDANLGSAPTYQDLEQYLRIFDIRLVDNRPQDFTLQHLKESGYVAVYLPQEGKAILDVGPVGPSYQPGHAHADTLSFELSLFGQRTLVNSGVSEYGISSLRTFQRSTQAHNTVCINDHSSSDIWAGFRVGQRASPIDLHLVSAPDLLTVQCAHDGYMAAPHRAIHTRVWAIKKTELIIYDTIKTKRQQVSKAYFYFHPDLSMMKKGPYEYEFIWGAHCLHLEFVGAKQVQDTESHWYPGFGTVVTNHCLVVGILGTCLETKMNWN